MDLLGSAVVQAVWLLLSGDAEVWRVTWLSLRVSLTATAISLLVGVPLGTWLARRNMLELPILVEGEPSLLNVYHVLPVNPARSPRINGAGGEAFGRWLVGAEAQAAIGTYGQDRFGQPLFVPDAGRDETELGTSAQPSPIRYRGLAPRAAPVTQRSSVMLPAES